MSKDILDMIEEDDFDEILEELDEDVEDSGEPLEGELVELEDNEDSDDDTMSEARARELTEAIRSAATVTYALLAQAHEKKAYKSLGYDTWAEYVKEEFEMSTQRSYQLLDLSRVTTEIESVVPEGTEVKITEAQARDIKRELPTVTEKIKEAIDEGESPAEAVDRIIDETREQKKADDKAIEEKQKKLEEAEEDGYRAGLEAAADALLESSAAATDEETETVESSSSGLSPEDSMNLYNFFNVLTGFSSLPEPDDFIKVIPRDRADEINNQILEAQSWINRFSTLWEIEMDDVESDVEADDDDTLY